MMMKEVYEKCSTKTSDSFSSSSSTCSSSSSTREFKKEISTCLPKDKYSMKTLCVQQKLTSMPTKEEYSVLLSNGLGARKWQVSFDLEADEFKRAIFKIYPRLSTVSGYSLHIITKEKTFEKLPTTVNTPKRIYAYLGSNYSGCLIITPSEKIPLISSESLHPEISKETLSKMAEISNRVSHRMCIICGKMAEHSEELFNIESQTLFSEDRYIPVFKKLKEMLSIDLPKIFVVPSEEICKQCLRDVSEITYLQTQLQRKKERLMETFFATTVKIGKMSRISRPFESFFSNWHTSCSNDTFLDGSDSIKQQPQKEDNKFSFENSLAPTSSSGYFRDESGVSSIETSVNNKRSALGSELEDDRSSEGHTRNSSLSPNSSPSPPNSGETSSDSSSSSSSRPWKKRYCELTKNDRPSCSDTNGNKRFKKDDGRGRDSEIDSGNASSSSTKDSSFKNGNSD